MAACAVSNEELAVALPGSVLEHNSVGVIIAIKGHGEFVEPHTVPFFSIALGFFYLPDHSTVHVLQPPYVNNGFHKQVNQHFEP
jgi:hypothetical protein